MRLKKLAGSISMFLIAALVLIINSTTSTVAEGLFKITAFSISDKAAGVDGTAELNSEGNVENSVVFYNVSDYVEYQISLQNTSSDSLIINDITINDTAYFTYLLSNNHAGKTIAPSEEIAFSLKVTYENENNTNDRHLGVSSININYSTIAGNTGSEEIPYDNGDTTNTTSGTAETTNPTANSENNDTDNKEELAVPSTSSDNVAASTTASDNLTTPNTGNSTKEKSTDAVFNLALAIAGSTAIVAIAYIAKHHKKLATTLSITILAFTFVSVTRAEEISTNIEIPIAGMINLKDKLAITFHTDGMEDTFIFRQLGETLNQVRMNENNETPTREGYYLYWPDYIAAGDGYDDEQYGYDTPLYDSMVLYPRWTPKFAMFTYGVAEWQWQAPSYIVEKFVVSSRISNKAKLLGLEAGKKIAKEFKQSPTRPSEEIIANAQDISLSGGSQEKIWMWYDEEDDTLYWWTVAPRIYAYNLTSMFAYLPVQKINLNGITFTDSSTWRLDRAWNYQYAFYGTPATEIDFGENWNTEGAHSFESMFEGSAFSELDLSSFNTSTVERVDKMFKDMKNLTDLNISTLTFTKTYEFTSMFEGDSGLQTIDLGSVAISKDDEYYSIPEFKNMFKGCSSLEKIYVSDGFIYDEWDPEDWSYYGTTEGSNINTEDYRVFDGANLLEGGNGTKYVDVRPDDGVLHPGHCEYTDWDSWCEDDTYDMSNELPLLRIDEPGKPGLLTRKETE